MIFLLFIGISAIAADITFRVDEKELFSTLLSQAFNQVNQAKSLIAQYIPHDLLSQISNLIIELSRIALNAGKEIVAAVYHVVQPDKKAVF